MRLAYQNQRILIAINADFQHLKHMTRGFPLHPQTAARPGMEMSKTGFLGFLKSRRIHESHHQHVTRSCSNHHCREQALPIKLRHECSPGLALDLFLSAHEHLLLQLHHMCRAKMRMVADDTFHCRPDRRSPSVRKGRRPRFRDHPPHEGLGEADRRGICRTATAEALYSFVTRAPGVSCSGRFRFWDDYSASSKTRAKHAITTRSAPARFNADTQAPLVAPLVRTSSTSRILPPFKLARCFALAMIAPTSA